MRTQATFITGISVCLVGLFAQGCQDSNTLSATAGASPELPNEVPVAVEAAEQVAGKPIPPIDISYEIRGEPQVGRPMQILVTTRSQVLLTDVSFQVYGDERVSIVPPAESRNAARVPRDEAMIRTLTVTPLLEGALRVSVLVQADINGVTQARNIVIPIQVGGLAVRAQPESPVQVDESGERIISLPAEEFP